MIHRFLGAALALALPAAATAATINFDDVATAPYLFSSGTPLVDQYAPLGIEFGGHGAILNAVSDFGVTGASLPNVLGYADAGQVSGSYRTYQTYDTIRFSSVQTSVSFDVGSGTSPLPLDIMTYDAKGGLLTDTLVTLGSALQTVALGGSFTSLAFSLVGARSSDGFALDNLTFTQGPAITTPEPAAVGLLALAVAGGIGFRRRAR